MNYYDTLKIDKNASEQEIKESYKKLIKRYHPDLYPGNKEKAEAITRDLNEAYETLSDSEKKAIYDFSLEEQNSNQSSTYLENTTYNSPNNWSQSQNNTINFDEKLKKNIYDFVDKKTKNMSVDKKKNIILTIIFISIITLLFSVIDLINFKISILEKEKKAEEMNLVDSSIYTETTLPTINDYFKNNVDNDK